jgi:hypothetical protein
MGLEFGNERWCDHISKSFERSHQVKVTILSSQQVQTDRNIPNNKTDITIRDNERGTCMYVCMLIDDVITGDRNVINKEVENILKYHDLIIDIEHMWNGKANMTPVIIGATETI